MAHDSYITSGRPKGNFVESPVIPRPYGLSDHDTARGIVAVILRPEPIITAAGRRPGALPCSRG